MVLAVDNQISLRVVEKLRLHYDVVMWAGDQSDEMWVEEALDRGATIFISPDLDIPNLLDRIAPDTKWIDVPQSLNKHNQYDYIVKQLKRVG